MLADELDYVVGVDPHRDSHAIAVVEVISGAVVFESTVIANNDRYIVLQGIVLQGNQCPQGIAYASGSLYFTNGDWIGRIAIDGSHSQPHFIHESAYSVAADATDLFWSIGNATAGLLAVSPDPQASFRNTDAAAVPGPRDYVSAIGTRLSGSHAASTT